MAERRAEVLSELVRLFSSGKDPISLAEAAVELVATATGAKSVFVYFWEPDIERLVLRTVTQVDIDLTSSRVEMRLGEGITGWSGLHRKPVILNRAIQDDPRFMRLEDVSEQDYRSVIAVPIYDESDLYGVFALYAAEENAFGELELAIAEEVGLLLASGLRRAETVRALEIQSATARFLTELPASATASLNSTVRYSVGRMLELLQADACVIVHPPAPGSSAEQVVVAERQANGDPRISLTTSQFAARDVEQRFESQGFHRISAPLGYGFSRGLVTCFRARPFTIDESHRLSVLVTQVSMLIDNSGVLPRGSELGLLLLTSNNDSLINENLESLGWRKQSSLPALVQIKHLEKDMEKISGALQSAVTQVFGSETLLVPAGPLMVLVTPSTTVNAGENISERFTLWAESLKDEFGLITDVGIGKPSDTTGSIGTSLAQARDALVWAQACSTRMTPRVVHFEEIASIKNLPTVVDSMKEGIAVYEAGLLKLDSYDNQHGTKLLDTLLIFASLGGSVVKTSEALFVHRNTLRQRLTRIEEVLGLPLNDDVRWTEIVLAAKLVRLSEML